MMKEPQAVVAAGHRETVRAVETVLAAGGNAVDGAIAGAAMACVAEPVLASLGGGGVLVTRQHDGTAAVYDFFANTPRRKNPEAQMAPADADFGTMQQGFQVGVGSITTPGMAPGLAAIHGAAGAMAWGDLIAPAITAAQRGIRVSAFQARLLKVVAPIYRFSPEARAVFSRFGDGADLAQEGDTLRFPEMADSLALFAAEGAAPFIDGEIAAAITDLCGDGGHLTAADLAGYTVVQRAPLEVAYRDARVLMNPAPASGGLLVAFGLNLLSAVDAAVVAGAAPGSAGHGATMRDVIDLTGAARVAADSDVERLLDPGLMAIYRQQVLNRARAWRGTTHISVIDRHGDAASMTLTNGEGCGLMAGGFMVNNMLGEDDLVPGGAWTPNCRLASMMNPSVVAWPDGGLAVLGSGGSARIRSAMLQVLSHLIDFGLAPAEAVALPRLHANGGATDAEPGALDGDRQATHWPGPDMFFGGVHVAARGADGAVAGCGDARRGGAWTAVTALSA